MKIVHTKDMDWAQAIDHGKFSQRRKALGGDKLACGLWELPPGKTSFPFHMHHVTEEAMFVLSGRAKVRTSGGPAGLGPAGGEAERSPVETEHEIGAGDFVSFPPGVAHQLINPTAEPMVYLAISATFGHDIVEYPDSGKVAVSMGRPPTGRRMLFRAKDQPDYFEGED